MVKTQVQFPEPLYRELRRVAAELGWPLAEVVRRGAEYMVRSHPPRHGAGSLPPAYDLGDVRVSHEDWRELANELPDDLER